MDSLSLPFLYILSFLTKNKVAVPANTKEKDKGEGNAHKQEKNMLT
jgi:hypothetical protein